MNKFLSLGLILLVSITFFSFSKTSNHIYLKVSSQRLHKNQVASSSYEILVNFDNGEMVMHYSVPEEFYVFTNKLGEMKVYYPKKNEVLIEQNYLFSSENDPIYHFFTNQSMDLGLTQMGFILKKSELDEHFLVTEWIPPIELMNQIQKVKLVQEDYLPVFISYVDLENNEKQKIYYSDWNMDCIAVYPQRITQIDYIPNNDSIISRKIYSNILIGSAAVKMFPSIRISDDARLIKPGK